ncbi:MAG: alpha/beta hydrolase [Pseudomonadota bacterium]
MSQNPAAPFVLPETAAVLELIAAAEGPHLAEMTAPEMRAVYRQMGEVFDVPAEADVRTVDFDHQGIALRVYHPSPAVAGPVIVYFHGGGWVIGDLETHDPLCSAIALISGLRVVAVDYRLAPEHTWPAAHDDCLVAVQFVMSNPAQLEAPVTGVAVAGDSAGGNLACYVAAELGQGQIVGQLLIYPAADCTAPEGGSYHEFAEGFVLDRRLMDRFIGDYLPAEADRGLAPLSPLLHPVNSDMPRAVIVTAGLDPLRDQGRDLAAQIAAVGQEVHFLEGPGLIHGLATMRKVFPSGDRLIRRAVTIFAEMIRND